MSCYNIAKEFGYKKYTTANKVDTEDESLRAHKIEILKAILHFMGTCRIWLHGDSNFEYGGVQNVDTVSFMQCIVACDNK